MFNFPLYENPVIEKSKSSFGNWVIKLSEVSFRFFFRKADAQKWLDEYKA